MSVRKSRQNYRQIYGKSKASLWRNLSTGTPLKFFRTVLCFVALVYSWFFFRTAVLWKLFDIRFSYKHCNFSLVCLLVKMVSKTVTRSIQTLVDHDNFLSADRRLLYFDHSPLCAIEEGSIAETSVKAVLNSVNFTIFKLTPSICWQLRCTKRYWIAAWCITEASETC